MMKDMIRYWYEAIIAATANFLHRSLCCDSICSRCIAPLLFLKERIGRGYARVLRPREKVFTLVVLLFLFVAPAHASAAIAFDAQSSSDTGTWTTSASSDSWSHTISGSDRILFVNVRIYDTGASNRSVSTISFNGVALTKVNSITAAVEGATQDGELWYLVAPATGTHTITVTLTGSVSHMASSAFSYTGVDQTNPIDSNNTGQNNTGTATFTLSTTVVKSNCWLVGGAMARDSGPPGAGSGTTLRGLNSGSWTTGADSNGTVGTGSQSLSFTHASGKWPVVNIASIAPVSAAAPASKSILNLVWTAWF